MKPMPFVSVPEALEEIRAGRILVVVDDEDRENEGDLTIAAEKVTPEIVNFMATHGRGLICLALTAERCDALRLPLMSARNTSNFGTAFCESIDAREGVTTGISAADRTLTIRQAIAPRLPLRGPGPPRPCFSPARPRWRRAGARRANRSLGGSGAHGRTRQLRRDLRNHERRRHHGARSATGGVLRPPQLEDDLRGRADPLPHEDRALPAPRRRRLHRYRIRSLPHHRLYQRAEPRIPPGAGARRRSAGAENVLVRMHARCLYGDVFGSTGCDCQRLVRDSLAAASRPKSAACWFTCTKAAPDSALSPEDGQPARLVSHNREFRHYQGAEGQRLLAARTRHRRPDPLRPGTPHHPPAHQPPPPHRRPGRLRNSDRRTGSGRIRSRALSPERDRTYHKIPRNWFSFTTLKDFSMSEYTHPRRSGRGAPAPRCRG